MAERMRAAYHLMDLCWLMLTLSEYGNKLCGIPEPHERARPVTVVGPQIWGRGIYERLQNYRAAGSLPQLGEKPAHGVHPVTGSKG